MSISFYRFATDHKMTRTRLIVEDAEEEEREHILLMLFPLCVVNVIQKHVRYAQESLGLMKMLIQFPLSTYEFFFRRHPNDAVVFVITPDRESSFFRCTSSRRRVFHYSLAAMLREIDITLFTI